MGDRAGYEMHAPARADGRVTVGDRRPSTVHALCAGCGWRTDEADATVLAAHHTQTTGHTTRAFTVAHLRLRLT